METKKVLIGLNERTILKYGEDYSLKNNLKDMYLAEIFTLLGFFCGIVLALGLSKSTTVSTADQLLLLFTLVFCISTFGFFIGGILQYALPKGNSKYFVYTNTKLFSYILKELYEADNEIYQKNLRNILEEFLKLEIQNTEEALKLASDRISYHVAENNELYHSFVVEPSLLVEAMFGDNDFLEIMDMESYTKLRAFAKDENIPFVKAYALFKETKARDNSERWNILLTELFALNGERHKDTKLTVERKL